VPGVVSTLKAHDGGHIRGQQINYFSLSLIAPLGAHDYDIRHESDLLVLMNCRQRNGKWLPSLRSRGGEVNLWGVRFFENERQTRFPDKNIAQTPRMHYFSRNIPPECFRKPSLPRRADDGRKLRKEDLL
jgi:hypothetical protein